MLRLSGALAESPGTPFLISLYDYLMTQYQQDVYESVGAHWEAGSDVVRYVLFMVCRHVLGHLPSGDMRVGHGHLQIAPCRFVQLAMARPCVVPLPCSSGGYVRFYACDELVRSSSGSCHLLFKILGQGSLLYLGRTLFRLLL